MSWHVIRSATTREHHGSYNTRPRDPARKLQLFQHPHIRNTVSSSTIRATSGSVVGFLHHLCKRSDRLSSYRLSVSFPSAQRSDRFSPRLPIGWLVVNDTQSLLAVRWRPYGLSSRPTPAEVAVVGSQDEVIRTGRLYVESTGLLGATRILHTGGE